ncbi:unnamed protein product, partial [Mesorhabditis belari]|uniref:Phosphatidylcholine transfer protein n=1 Tax=Mesorhabditis belari TaxID=2138241 RepID=A0AAF3EGA7_9BILA
MKLRETLGKFVSQTPGVQHIWIADRDGVPLLGTGEDHRMRTGIIESQVGAHDQHFVLGQHRSSMYFYQNHQLVVFQIPPVVVYVLADGDANTGFILKLREKLEPLLTQIEQLFPRLPLPFNKFRLFRNHVLLALSGGIFTFQQHGLSNERLQECSGFAFDRNDQRDLKEGWEPLYEDKSKNLRVFRRKVKDDKLDVYEYRVAGTFYDITPRNYIDAQSDVAYRSEWDANVMRLEVIQEDGDQQLIRWVSKYPYPMYAREYVFIRRTTVSDDGRVVMIYCEAVPEEVIPTSSRKNVRVATYASQSAVRAHKDLDTDGLDYVLTYFDNPEANIPRYIYNWIVNQGGPYFVNQVHTAAKKLEKSGRKVKSFLNSDKKAPTVCEAPVSDDHSTCTHCPIHCPKAEETVTFEALDVTEDPTEMVLPSKLAEKEETSNVIETLLTVLQPATKTRDKVSNGVFLTSEQNNEAKTNDFKRRFTADEIFAQIE